MSLFGSLFTGVSGLGAQSQSTAMIANNIANVNTIGFKRSEAAFYSLVTSEGRSSRYSPGTVAVNRIQRVNQQGPIQQTGSTTDAAISGNGMFAVKRSVSGDQEFLYTRSGSFSEDAQGLLRNTAGFVLYGWPLDSNGDLPSNQGDLTSLVPADVAFLGGLTRPTSSGEISLNLNADEVDNVLGAVASSPADFTRGLTVYDSLGSAQVLTFEYTKTYGPQGTAAGSVGDLSATDNLVNDLGMTVGNSFSIAVDGGAPVTFTITAASTINDIITAINAVTGAEAFLGNDGELVFQRTEFEGGAAQEITIANVVGTPLIGLGMTAGTYASNDLSTSTVQATGTTSGLAGATLLAALGLVPGDTLTIDLDGAGTPSTFTVGAGDDVNDILTFIDGVTGVPGSAVLDGSGRIQVTHSNASPNDAEISFGGVNVASALGFSTTQSYYSLGYANGSAADTPPYSSGGYPSPQTLPGDTGYNSRGWWNLRIVHPNGTTLSNGLVNFSGDGTLNALPDSSGNIDINLTQIDWGNGSDPQNIDLDIERFSQFAGNYNVIFSDQNGAELGLRTGVEITRDGFVVARFSNGASANLYKIPLVTFANVNGLTEVSGTAYTENELSGEENLREAGQGGAGFLEASTIESSNVDLADEFAKLIVSQRAYSANTKVITTVDQMTEELLRLR
ncbi:MAG: flagellar hook-basal body complex protein [Micavibrio aeruginosavorus]|uniref:Flagellar hook protein FlgE n=1 Tax=Micavibrio aeruginosavorus TaxID=349221 RepID=A0A7T5R1N1_9BACT|nr:MAG: flagellar hook-basal body complex protein [Micavibrio aeruginosavorus]